jgi:hypothetical protein
MHIGGKAIRNRKIGEQKDWRTERLAKLVLVVSPAALRSSGFAA